MNHLQIARRRTQQEIQNGRSVLSRSTPLSELIEMNRFSQKNRGCPSLEWVRRKHIVQLWTGKKTTWRCKTQIAWIRAQAHKAQLTIHRGVWDLDVYAGLVYCDAVKAWGRFKPPYLIGPINIYSTSLRNCKDGGKRRAAYPLIDWGRCWLC